MLKLQGLLKDSPELASVKCPPSLKTTEDVKSTNKLKFKVL